MCVRMFMCLFLNVLCVFLVKLVPAMERVYSLASHVLEGNAIVYKVDWTSEKLYYNTILDSVFFFVCCCCFCFFYFVLFSLYSPLAKLSNLEPCNPIANESFFTKLVVYNSLIW